MRAYSAVTQITDPYRAGLALGQQLESLRPEVVFLFSSIHAGASAELLQGFHDVLSYHPLVVGASGDGVFFQGGTLHAGSSALGLNSDGRVRWHLVCVPGVVANPGGVARQALGKASAWLAGKTAPLMFLFSDFRADASELEKALQSDAACPVIGGLAGDDNQMQDCALFANRELLRDCLLLLVVEGEFHFSLALGHRLSTLGRIGRVEQVEGRRLLSINGASAQDFIADQFGRKAGASDVTTLALLDGESDQIRRLRSVFPQMADDGALDLYAAVEPGDRVQVCLARPEELMAEVRGIAEQLATQTPLAALLISCAGRKIALGQALGEEVTYLEETFPELPLAGFPSFGEIAPLPLENGSFSRNLFHNMTYVLLLITP